MLNSWSFSRNSAGQKGMAGYIWSTEREKYTTKITVPSKDLIQNWWRNKKFSDKQKLREFSTTKPALQQMLKGLILSRNTREEKRPGGGHGNPLQYSCLVNPYGQRSLAGCSPWGRKELDTTEWLHFTFTLFSYISFFFFLILFYF